MPEMDFVTHLTQFGTAGLIAWMWLTERRHALAREELIRESMERLKEQRVQLEALLGVVQANTRALAALETSQRRVVSAIERAFGRTGGAGAPGGAEEAA